MTKQTANWGATAALVLAVVALISQFVFAATGHATRSLAAEIAWPVLLVICIGLFFWGAPPEIVKLDGYTRLRQFNRLASRTH